MKIVKVRIRTGDLGKGENQMVYPARYNAQEVERRGIGPGGVMPRGAAYSGHIGRGGDEEWCFVMLRDDLADEYAQDPDMEIVTVRAAEAAMEQWRKLKGETEEIVTDVDRIHAIRAKQEAGLSLTKEDRLALDVESDIPGVEKRLKPLRAFWAKRGVSVE